MNIKDYKLFHESFMQKNNGTTAFDTFSYIFPAAGLISTSIQMTTLLRLVNVPARFLIEFITICVSIVLYTTVLSGAIQQISWALVLIWITSAIRQLRSKLFLTPFVQITSSRPDYISVSRAVICLLTAICILAVDFQCFPRKLAKTEHFGFSLMDVGVGLFIFSNGIICRPSETPFTIKKMQRLCTGCVPLFVLGLSRFVVTREIDYQGHVSEYGVHWNFFITLAVTKIVGTLIEGLLKNLDYLKIAAVGILFLHEAALQMGVADYIMNDNIPRNNFITANKEGIFSTPGYISLYLASIYIGTLMKSENEISKAKEVFKRTLKIGLVSLISWKMIFVCDGMFGVSRRACNMGYVFWIIAVGSTMVTLFMMLELFIYYINFNRPQLIEERNKSQLNEPNLHLAYVPIILESINYNGLAFFLLANLLTGLVNILFQTMLLPTGVSIAIILYYIFILNVVTVFLYVNKIQLKVW